VIPRQKSQGAHLALGELFDARWNDDALAALVDGDDAVAARAFGAAPPRAVWESALLGPARDMLTRPGKRFRSELVTVAGRLAGGRDVPAGLPLVLEIIHAGSLIVDDIEDDSSARRGAACLHRLHGVPVALNAGNWLYFWPFQLVGELGLADDVVARLRDAMSRAMFHCHFGQALDVSAHVGTLPQRWVPSVVAAATSLKTGRLTELAATMGAIAAGATHDRVDKLARFGRRLGVALQMFDDVHNLAIAEDGKRHEDLRLGRPTWPWAWAAQDLDEVSFAALQADARVVTAQVRAGAPVDAGPLAQQLAGATAMRGRRAARVLLDRALADLRASFPGAPETDVVADELRRLEAAYA
jgi:geranylgeranyl pyrophosphate synthase